MSLKGKSKAAEDFRIDLATLGMLRALHPDLRRASEALYWIGSGRFRI